ncbi:MAG: diacylglycerol kinase family protein [Eubacteriales bacterium]|nr:diacylglycerol kinase family protein [Eubacteriales bacterium]
MLYILYNPKANCGKDTDSVLENVKEYYSGRELTLLDITEIDDIKAYFGALKDTDEVVLVGGDGTLNVLCNKLRGFELKNNLYLFKAGTGNDFLRDIDNGQDDNAKAILINEYIENLPVVTINNKEYLFINNVGYGIDGQVCTVADEMKAQGKTDINYTTLSIKLLLTKYKSCGATVTAGNKRRKFKKVWLAPVMNGLYYGGGLMPCPQQDRNSTEISCCAMHNCCSLKALMIFPSIFKGKHINKKKNITVMSADEITVEFDSPRDVQIDGEVIRDVTVIKAKKYKTATQRDEKLKKATV